MNNIYNKLSKYLIENQNKFYRLCYTYVRNENDALDVVQNAMLKALEKYKTIRDINAINTWFYKILVNENLLYLRKKKKEICTEDKDLDSVYFENYNENIDIYDKLKFLPTDTQTIIILHYFEDLTLLEISKITNININTVKSKLYTGLKKLRIEFSLRGIEDEEN